MITSASTLAMRSAAPTAPKLGLGPCTRLTPKLRNVVMRSGGTENADMYIGFPKNDYLRPAGRKGRVIKDDPSRYPDRNEYTGGWAGGEAGLKKFIAEIKEEQENQVEDAPQPKPSARPVPGKKAIYLGFGKDELALKNTGVPGRVIYDDETKYPAKEDLAFLSGVTGGFAGGELGVQGFAATGELKLRQPGEPGGQGISPLNIIFLFVAAGGAGAYFYLTGALGSTEVFNAEAFISSVASSASEAASAAVGTEDKTPIFIGLGLIGSLALLAAAKSAFDSVKDEVPKVLTVGAFLAVVLLAAKAIIES